MTPATAPVRYRFAHFELQLDERRLLAGGQPADLGPHAFDLLVALVQAQRQPRHQGRAAVPGLGQDRGRRQYLQAHISALRKVLGS